LAASLVEEATITVHHIFLRLFGLHDPRPRRSAAKRSSRRPGVRSSHKLAHPGWLPRWAGRVELGRVRLDVQDRGSVDSVETLHGQLQAGDLQQGADRDAEVVRAGRRMSGKDPDLWPCRVTPRVGGAAPDPWSPGGNGRLPRCGRTR
jgi:hypothetical protein